MTVSTTEAEAPPAPYDPDAFERLVTRDYPQAAHLLDAPSGGRAAITSGYVTSACHSPTLGHAIGLGRLRRGRERLGADLGGVGPLDELAQRLVAFDLLEPASALLQYQVDNRLRGVGKASSTSLANSTPCHCLMSFLEALA